MNKAVSFLGRGLCFKHNIGKIRKTIMDYLKNEGIKAEILDGYWGYF